MALLLETGDALLLESAGSLLLQIEDALGVIVVAGPLGDAQAIRSDQRIRVSIASPLNSVRALRFDQSAIAAFTSPLGSALSRAYSQFNTLAGEQVFYVCDLLTPSGPVRVQISSWQATLQTNRPNYLQAVVQSVVEHSDALLVATGFRVSARSAINDIPFEYEIASVEEIAVSSAKSGNRYTATVSGYSDAFAEDLDPPAIYDRQLRDIRTVFSAPSGRRTRCAIDYLLRPSHRVFINESDSYIAAFINFYATNQGGTVFDAYMDVGERS